jgi:hypothetical protein
MSASARSRAWNLGIALLAVCMLAVLGVFALQGWIRYEAGRTAATADAQFHSGRIQSLARLVECAGCPMRARNRAIWALGELGDPSALPALKRQHTGETCDHETRLCQYELDKAIRKIEGTWGLQASLKLDRLWR